MERSIKTMSLILGFVVFLTILNSVFIFKYHGNRITDIETQTVAELKRDLECMALNVYREAAHEPIEGRIAVAQVTMNRVASPDFPNSICEVVYQKNKVMEKVVCQFSWYCDSTHRNRPINQQAYQESMEVAKKVVLENFRLKSLEEALYYHADYVNPRWRLERIEKIGAHIFYKPRNETKIAGL